MHDPGDIVALVGVDPAQENQYPVMPVGDREGHAAVALGAGCGEAGEIGHRDLGEGLAQRRGGR